MERKNLLYEIPVFHEWCMQDSEAVHTSYPNYNALISSLTKSGSAASQNLIKSIKEDNVGWQFSVGMKGKIVALLTDTTLEIRSAKDSFVSAVASIAIGQDPDWSLRRIAWSLDGTLLACCSSSGTVEVFDLIGTKLYEVFSSKQHNQGAKAACLFSTVKTKSLPWSSEMILIDFSGNLNGYFVSDEGFQESCTFSFAKYYPGGVSAAAHHSSQPGIFVAGLRSDVPQTGSATSFGISSWRIIDSEPYFEVLQIFENPTSILAMISSKFIRPKTTYDVVLQMSPSPNGKRMGVIHLSGAISIWSLPSALLEKYLHLEDQPGFDELSPELLKMPARKRAKSPLMKNPRKYHPVEINWWSEEHLIIARMSGAISVVEVENFRNILGSSPEFLNGVPRISQTYKNGFLALECEVKNLVRKRTVSDDESAYETYSDDSDEEEGVAVRAKKVLRSALFWATDSEKFQPPRKKPKIVFKTYRLLGVKSTTPQELYARKLDQEEYGEALLLARTYGLDTDLVFQRQWRSSDVTMVTIKDYLYKVKNRSWVLNECLTWPAKDPDAARELLQYGIKISDLDTVVALAEDPDNQTVILPPSRGDEFEDPNMSYDSVIRLRQQREETRKRHLLEKIDFRKLNDQQKLILGTRRKLLQYSDRLFTYEAVLGGPHKAPDFFDPKFFLEFRSKTALQAAFDFAHAGNYEAVALMLTYHSIETLPYRLALVAAIPETLEPFSYRDILPECDNQGEPFRWDTLPIRNADWSETDHVAVENKIEPYIDPAYDIFYNQDCNAGMITAWYIQRAKEIESKTKLVANAADLVRLGVERNVQGLEEIYDQLATLETLVYECQLLEGTSLRQMQSASDLEIARLIMSKTTPGNFVNDLHYILLPFLDRCDRRQPGQGHALLEDYLRSSSEESLSLALLLFEHEGKAEGTKEALIKDSKALIRLAIDCVYACKSLGELDSAYKIYECLPERGDDDDEMTQLQDKADELERVLNAVNLLKKYDVKLSFRDLKKKSENFEESRKILGMLSRQLIKKQVKDENEWKTLLRDMLRLRDQLLTKVSPQICCEFVIESLLSSGDEKLMQLAASLIDGTNVPSDQFSNSLACRVLCLRGQEIALGASREYMDSAGGVDDKALKQARVCLAMFTAPSQDIMDELNLVAGVQLLGELGVDILPLQVRLREDRMSLVEMAVKARPKNYRNPVKLIRLGKLLRACEGKQHDIEGTVLTLCAERAIEAGDTLTAMQTCKQISQEGFESGWKVCWQMAIQGDLNDNQLREELLNFALVHCTEETIAEILKVKSGILREKIAEQLRNQIESHPDLIIASDVNTILQRECIFQIPEIVEEDSKLDEAKKQLFEVANQSARHIYNTVSKTDKFIKDVTGRGKSDVIADIQGVNAGPGCIAASFYEDVWKENFLPSPSEITYTDFSMPKIRSEYLKFFTNLGEFLLTSQKDLDEEVYEGILEHLYSDNHLQFHALMLREESIESVWKVFEKLRTSETCLMYAAYQISIRLLSGMGYGELMETIYRRSFREVVQRALKLPKSKLKTDVLKQGYDLLHECWNLLGDTIQARQLKRLDPNVDAARFATDEQYKKDTIVGLAITTDESLYSSAIQLAERFGVDVWEVHYGFFFALMVDSQLESSQLEAKLNEKRLIVELKKEQEKLEQRMEESIYSTLSGADHGRAMLFFNILLSSNEPKRKEKADNAIKVLKKLKQYRGIDFKKLVSSKDGFIEEVYPVLGSENVNNIVKLAGSVSALGVSITPSAVYATVSEKVILEGHSRPGKPANSQGEWLSRFDECKDFFAKLDHRDFEKVIDRVCFSKKATELVPTSTRCDFLNRGLKFVRQLIGKMTKEFRTEEERMWSEVKSTLESWLAHLTVYASDIADHLREDEAVISYIRNLESTKGDSDQIISVQKDIALFHPRPLDALQSVSVLLPVDSVLSPEGLLIDVINEILEKLRDTKTRSIASSKLVSQLKSRVAEAKRACDDDDLLIMEDDLREPMEKFVADKSVTLATRIAVAVISPKAWQDSPLFKSLLLAGTTLDLIQSHWPSVDATALDEDTFSSEEKRYELFSTLLALSTSSSQLRELLGMLAEWPDFEAEKYGEPDSHPVVLISAELERGKVTDVEPVVIDIITRLLDVDHPPEIVNRVFNHILPLSRRLALKLALYVTRRDLLAKVLNYGVLTESDFDQNILDLIRRKALENMFEGTVLESALKKSEPQSKTKDVAFLSKWVPSSLGNIATGLWGGRGKK